MSERKGSTKAWVALLRGVNVGRAKRVAMADLRRVVEGLGYGAVRTLLNSGNVVFVTPRRERADPGPRIDRALASELGLDCRVTAIDAAALDGVIAGNPLLAEGREPARMLVALWREPGHRARLEPLEDRGWSPEAFALGPRAAYLWCAGGILESPLLKAMERALGQDATSRNWSTWLKLQAMTREVEGGEAC